MFKFKRRSGTASLEYALLAGVVTFSIGGSLYAFSEEVETGICHVSLKAFGLTGEVTQALDCATETASVDIPGAGTGAGLATEEVPFEDEPSNITRFGKAGEYKRYVIGWTATEQDDMTFEEDDSFSETYYAKFIDLSDGEYLCEKPEYSHTTHCTTRIVGMPVEGDRNSPLREMAVDANHTDMVFSGFNYGNLDVNFKNIREHGTLQFNSSLISPRFSINAHGSKNRVQAGADAELRFSNGNYLLGSGNQGQRLVMSNSRNHSETLISSMSSGNSTDRDRNANIDTRHENHGGYKFMCRHSANVNPDEVHPYFGQEHAKRPYVGYDEIEAIGPNGASTFMRWYNERGSDSTFGLQFIGIDEECDPYSVDYNFLQYFSDIPEVQGVTHYAGFSEAIMDWALTGDDGAVIRGDKPMSETRSIKFVFEDLDWRYFDVSKQCKDGVIGSSGSQCITTFRNLPRADISTPRFSLTLDNTDTERTYRGFPTGPWDLDIVNYPERFTVIQPMSWSDAQAQAHVDFRVDANSGVVWLNSITDGENLHYTLNNGQFMINATKIGYTEHTPSSISLTPEAVDEDTIVRIWDGEYSTTPVKIKHADPAAGDYTFYCKSEYPETADYADVNGIFKEDLRAYNGYTRRAYDEIKGLSSSGKTLTYRVYMLDPGNRSFESVSTLCDKNGKYFN